MTTTSRLMSPAVMYVTSCPSNSDGECPALSGNVDINKCFSRAHCNVAKMLTYLLLLILCIVLCFCFRIVNFCTELGVSHPITFLLQPTSRFSVMQAINF